MKKQLLFLLTVVAALTAQAQTARKFTVNITADGASNMQVFLPEQPTGRCVVCCPGGGYQHLAMAHEGTDWAPYFNEQGIDTSNITRCTNGEKLGLTFTEMKSPIESDILMYRNRVADLQLSVDDIKEEYIRQAKAILISGTALAESPSREAALKAVMLARRVGTKIIFDIDYRNYNWKNLDEISIYCSIVAKESTVILGSREEFDLTEKELMPGLSDEESAKMWHNYHARIVVIKHGMQGSTAYTRDGQKFSIRPFPVQARKGFGGGDGYASGFLYGLFHNWEIIDCLEFGSAEASMMVRANNCSDDLPNPEQVHAFIKEEKEKYGDMIARV